MYPDILMICSPLESINSYTLQSLLKFAPNSKVILGVSSLIKSENPTLLQKRLNVLNKSTSEYVLFLDSDDALDMTIPSINELKTNDAHLYNCFDVDNKIVLNPYNKYISRLFGFHMVICKRELALSILQKYKNEKVYRDDICFLYGIFTQSKNIKYHNSSLTMKFGSRVVQYADKVLQNGFQKDVKDVWDKKFKELSDVDSNL